MMKAKNAVVTGAGGGIGLRVSARLAKRGFTVYGIGRNLESLKALNALLANGTEGRVVPLVADVADRVDLELALGDVGSVSVLVSCAGVCAQANLKDPDADKVWSEVMAINAWGVWNTFRSLSMRMEKKGRAVVVSSGLGKLGRAGYGAYTASKHAVLGLVKCFARELACDGITVNAVCPGWVDTDMARADLARTAERLGTTVDAARVEVLRAIPLKRFVQADEVAALIDWLTGDESGAVTGQAYNISCGEFYA